MSLGCSEKMKCSTRVLSLASLIVGLVSAGALSLAVATDYWLYTKEALEADMMPDYPMPEMPEMMPMPMPGMDEGNWTDIEGEPEEPLEPFVIKMHSGLWRMCMYQDEMPDDPPDCSNIAYFEQEWGRVAETDTTNSINRAIRKSSPVIVFSLILLMISLAISTVGSSKRNRSTIVGAVSYIISALCLAIGVIFYISAVNDEVSHRKKSSGSDDSFQYNYGWAFFFAGSSFISSMVAAVTNVSLYLKRYPNLEDMVMIIPGLEKQNRLADKGDDLDYDVGNQNPTIIL